LKILEIGDKFNKNDLITEQYNIGKKLAVSNIKNLLFLKARKSLAK